jgi:hypothetical protein
MKTFTVNISNKNIEIIQDDDGKFITPKELNFGTALKPAAEFWWLVRKPLSENTVAENVLKHGTGGINIDTCRVGVEVVTTHSRGKNQAFPKRPTEQTVEESGRKVEQSVEKLGNTSRTGRFPANLILSHTEGCKYIGTKEVKGHNPEKGEVVVGFCTDKESTTNIYGKSKGIAPNQIARYAKDGKETVENWECTEDCPVRLLDEQVKKTMPTMHNAGNKLNKINQKEKDENLFKLGFAPLHKGADSQYTDNGGASRFFKTFEGESRFYYCAKTSTSERNEGMDDDKNNHPTVKSIRLMSYLCKLVTPPNGLILDPFMGSGSTGVAAINEGFKFIGIEKEKDYFDIAEKRINHAISKLKPK